MKNLKLKIFDFKQKLSLDQSDISLVTEKILNDYDNYSEKEIRTILNEKLLKYSYDVEVKKLLETVDNEINSNSLTYDLKDLYKVIERQNQGMIYRQPLNTLLEIINKDNDDSKLESILNELKMYDWIPEIKKFIFNLTQNPIERQNMSNSGKGESIYTIVEKVNNGYLAYVADKWFLLNENEVTQTLLEDNIEDDERLRELRIVEQALKLANIENNIIKLKVDEYLTVGLSTKDKSLFINNDKLDTETTLENVFNSPIIPYLKKDYYMLINTLKENLNNIVELDIAVKVDNILNPYLEAYAFNYKDKMYLYSKDLRTGSSFYQYESVNELIHDVRKELDYDLTPFFENKLSKEMKKIRTLEDREKVLEKKIKDTQDAIDELQNEKSLLENDKDLKLTFDNLLIYKHNLNKKLNELKNYKTQYKKVLVNK
jgi:Ca2+-binding EF-hand superfamily protein